MEEKGPEVIALSRLEQEKDISCILEKTAGNPSDRDVREIDKIKNRQTLPGKKWFMKHKPGKLIFHIK